MTPALVLGPLLRYTGQNDATVWLETDRRCEAVVVEGGETHSARTFCVGGHHYALIYLTNLEPGRTYEYEVRLDGEPVWPEPGSEFPPSVIRTIDPERTFRLAFGSCRVSAPHEPPYTLEPDEDKRGHGRDALYALALRMIREPQESWPDALLLLGDQVYADEVSPGTREFIHSRRDPSKPPGEEVADFEEYTRLYWDSWKDPTVRWLLSTVPSAMIFDDHDVHDDWNTSEIWVHQMRKKPWWEERIIGAFMSYWIYQHLGNLSPEELKKDELFAKVQQSEDATSTMREFARRADRETSGTRWSFHRDFGKTRLIVVDSRAGRVLENGRRSMLDDEEWAWIEDQAQGDFDHLLIGTSLPLFLAPGLHHLEAWNEAVCEGAWGGVAARLGESVRQALDLEHWAAFHDSFEAFASLLESVAAGEHPPASIVILSGDVHHGYLIKVDFGEGNQVSSVYQAVGSPLRNQLGRGERSAMRAGWSKPGELIGRSLARLAGVRDPRPGWRLERDGPWFDNHISTLELRGRRARIRVEKTRAQDPGDPNLHPLLERRLA